METGMWVALAQNAALLLALILIYDLLTLRPRRQRPTWDQVFTGLAVGLVSVAVMMASIELRPGLVFDTRSILLAVSGLFFGTTSTTIAAVMAALYRLQVGGPGTGMGLAVIVTASAIGVAWRHLRKGDLSRISWLEVFFLGIVVHAVMLLCTVLLPGEAARQTLPSIALPVLLIYPAATAILGTLLSQRLERKRTLIALAESEGRFREIVEHSTNLFYRHTPDHVLTYVSPQSAHFLGCSPEEARVRWTEFVTDDPVNQAGYQATQRAIETGKPQPPYPLQLRTKDGRVIWVEVHETPVVEAGKTVAIVGALTDITDRRRAEEALRTSEENYREIFNSTNEAIFIDEASTGRMVDVNESMLRMYGHASKEEVLAGTIGDLSANFPPYTEEAAREHIRKTLEEGPQTFEWLAKRKGGETFWAEVSLRSSQIGGQGRILAVVRDISERKGAEEALKRWENLLDRIFDTLPVGLWIADREGRLVRSNPAGRRIWGGEPLVGREDYGVFKARRLPSREEVQPEEWSLVRTVREGISVLGEMLEIDAFDGQKRTILNSTAPVLDDKGRVEAAVIVNLDISDLRRAEEEKEALQAQLLQAQKIEAIGRLAGGVAHDFNNMLNIITIYAELALRRLGPEDPLRRDIEEIQKAARRSAGLTKQLLGFARKQQAMPKVLDLNESLKDMVDMLSRLMGEDVEFSFLPGEDLWPVRIDPVQVDQILANLAANARDAIEGVGRVSVETRNTRVDETFRRRHPFAEPGDYVLITFSDTGRGMDEETLGRIFEPFYSTKEHLGTGLGLATVYGIVKQNGGIILVDSTPGRGATFRVYLPRWRGGIEPSRPEAGMGPGGRETVLVVEDESAILELARRILASHGYTVLTAGSPGEAISVTEKHPGPIDLLLTDVVMPVLNGRELAARLAVRRPTLRALYMSGYAADVVAREGVIEEGVLFLEKPFTVERLLTAVRRALDG
jgi:PAS domain S-box-containing protein